MILMGLAGLLVNWPEQESSKQNGKLGDAKKKFKVYKSLQGWGGKVLFLASENKWASAFW